MLIVPIVATTLTAFASSSQAVASNNSLTWNQSSTTSPLNQTSIELTEENQELFGDYETITRLMSSLHGRIGIDDDAMTNYRLGRQDPHYIDPKDLKLVSVNDLEKYDNTTWVRINEQEIVLQCGIVNAATGEDWARMQRCHEEEVAIRRLMATFNEEGHQFVVSVPVLQMAHKIPEGAHRCIKTACSKLSIPTPAAMLSQRAVPVNFQTTTSQIASDSPQPTTLVTVTRILTLEDSLPKSQIDNEIIDSTPSEELPVGRWLSRREDDPYITIKRPECLDPPNGWIMSGKVKTFTRNPRKTSYTTISWWGFTTTSSVPYPAYRPPPKPSIVTPDWVTASFFQTYSCRAVWMEYLNMDHYWKRDIVGRVLEDLQAAARR